MDVPGSPGALTGEWLQAVLGRGPVRGFEVEPMSHPGFSSVVVRIRVDLMNTPESLRLVAKFGHPRQGLWAYRSFYLAEARVYGAGLVPDTLLPRPHCYFAHISPRDRQFLLVLEDVSGPCGGHLQESLTPAEISAVVRQLAEFHAHWWERAAPASWTWIAETGKELTLDGDVQAFLAKTLAGLDEREAIGSSLRDRFQAQAGLLSHTVVRCREEFVRGPATTIIHGDVHPGNVIFRRTEDTESAVWLDWQCLSRAKAVYDLALLIGSNTPTEIRRQREAGWLRDYVAALESVGIRYPWEKLTADYRMALVFSGLRWLGVALAVSGRTPTEERDLTWARQTVERIGTVFDDWNVLQ